MSLPKHLELYRARLHCKIARDALDGTGHPSDNEIPPMDYAIFCLSHAIEQIAAHLEKQADR